jgi:hypothetical protein
MKLTAIDYSEVCFALLEDSPVPRKRGGKFVVMTNGDRHYAVFSPRELSAYHANIIERFLQQEGIQGRYNEKGDVFYFSSAEWKVDGGGFWELDESRGLLQLSGNSQSYGGADLQRLAAELNHTDTFRALQVAIVQEASIL